MGFFDFLGLQSYSENVTHDELHQLLGAQSNTGYLQDLEARIKVLEYKVQSDQVKIHLLEANLYKKLKRKKK